MIEIWSCDPKYIPEWTYDKELEFNIVLADIFNLDESYVKDAEVRLKEKYKV